MPSEEKRQAIATLAVVSAFLVLVLLVATLGGGLKSHERGRSELTIAEIDISAEALGIADALLNVTTCLDNRGEAKSGEVRVLVKAYDAETNLLVASNETVVGEIGGRAERSGSASESWRGSWCGSWCGGGEGREGESATKSASTLLRLPKEGVGGYRLQVVVFEDGKGILRGERRIYGLSRLEPPSDAKISIRELDFFVEAVERAEGDEEGGGESGRESEGEGESGRESEMGNAKGKEYAIVNTTLYIDNLGEDVRGLRALVKARENETRLISDRRWEELGFLKTGTTTLHYAELRVLNGRDYIIEVQIWQSDRIIKEGRGMVLLSPFAKRTVLTGAEEKTVEISPTVKITDFIAPEVPVPTPVPYRAPAEEGARTTKVPGFETLSAAFAVFSAFILVLRLKKRRRGV